MPAPSKPAKRGRPAAAEAPREQVRVYFSPAEQEKVIKVANGNVSDFVRQAALEKAEGGVVSLANVINGVRAELERVISPHLADEIRELRETIRDAERADEAGEMKVV